MKKKDTAPRGEKQKVDHGHRTREANEDVLSLCAQVFLFSLSTNRGEKRKYEGALRCSGEEGGQNEKR